MADLSPEVKRLAVAAMRATRWVPQGELVSGCVHDTRDAVVAEVMAALHDCKAAFSATQAGEQRG